MKNFMKYLNDELNVDQTYIISEYVKLSKVFLQNKYAQIQSWTNYQMKIMILTNNLSIIIHQFFILPISYNKNFFGINISKDNFFEPLVTELIITMDKEYIRNFLIFMMKIDNLIVFYQNINIKLT